MRFTDIVVSEIPDSYAEMALGVEDFEPVDLRKARRQHRAYVAALESTGVQVTVLPPDEQYPDCVFVEDPAIIIGKTALITRPGDPSRRGETRRCAHNCLTITGRN